MNGAKFGLLYSTVHLFLIPILLVGRVPLNAPKIAGCSGNSPYIYVEEADDDPGMRRAALPKS